MLKDGFEAAAADHDLPQNACFQHEEEAHSLCVSFQQREEKENVR